MRIVYKNHKKKSLFPLELIWVANVRQPNGYSYTQNRYEYVDDEEELWIMKDSIERHVDFIYWKTDWYILEDLLDDEG